MYDKIFEKINKDNKEIINVLNDIVNFNVSKEEDFLKLMEIREKYPNFHQSNLKTFDEWNELGYRIKKGSVATKLFLDKDYKKSYFDIKQVYPTKDAIDIYDSKHNMKYVEKLEEKDVVLLNKLKIDTIINFLNTEVLKVLEYEYLSKALNYMVVNKYRFIPESAFNRNFNENAVFERLYEHKSIFNDKEEFERVLKINIQLSKQIFRELDDNVLYKKHLNNAKNNIEYKNIISEEEINKNSIKYLNALGYNFLDKENIDLFIENVKIEYSKQSIKSIYSACDEASKLMNLQEKKFEYFKMLDNDIFDYDKIKNVFNNNYDNAVKNIEKLSNEELKETYINIYEKAPYSLRVVGIDENTKVRISLDTIKHIDKHFDKDTKDELIKQIPDMLSNPVCILNGSTENSYVIMTEVKYGNDNIVIPFKYEKTSESVDLLEISTMYEKWNTEYFLEKELINHNVLAFNQQKMEQIRDPYDRLFLPKGDECSIYNNNITKSLDNVKYCDKNNNKYYEFETDNNYFKPVFKANYIELNKACENLGFGTAMEFFNNYNRLRSKYEKYIISIQNKLIENRTKKIEAVKDYYKSIGKYKELENIKQENINNSNSEKQKNNENYTKVLNRTKEIQKVLQDNHTYSITSNYVYNDMIKMLDSKIKLNNDPNIKDKEIIEKANAISDEYIEHWSKTIEEEFKKYENSKNKQVLKSKMIKDFGEKIGGAKKDLWREKGLSIANLSEMNEKEQAKYVTKSNIWIKPKYQELIDNGKERAVVYFYKTVIDAIPTLYNHSSNATLEEITKDNEKFIRFVNKVKDMTLKCNTLEDCKNCINVFTNTFLDKKNYSVYAKEEYSNINLNKLYKTISKWNWYTDYFIRDMNKKEFCASDIEKINARIKGRFILLNKADFNITETDKKDISIDRDKYLYKLKISNNTLNATWYITKEEYDIIKNHNSIAYDKSVDREAKFIISNTTEELHNKMKELVSNDKISVKSKTKKRFKYKDIELKRTGNIEYLSGNASGDDFLNTFKFKGGEFGNWLNDKERQDNLNFAFNSFKDIAIALDIKDEDISLNGKLSIAFGSRGSGSALAHYEPLRNVINLTKLKGAGSLAHEYGHFLDNNINELMKNKGTFASETCSSTLEWKGNASIKSAYQQLMNTMKTKVASKEEQELYRQKELKSCKEQSVMRYFDRYKDTTIYHKIESLFEKESYSNNDYYDVKKELSNLDLNDKEKRAYDFFVSNEKYINSKLDKFYKLKSANLEGLKIDTNYYIEAKDLNETYSKMGHDYWSSDCELFARSFSCYINDKLLEKGITNTYLTGHCESAAPIGEERKAINKSFDNLFEEIKKINLIFNNNLTDNIQEQKENKYTELIDTLKSHYAHPDSFIKNMNSIKDTKGIDIAIGKLKDIKTEFDNSDAIINQAKNQIKTL